MKTQRFLSALFTLAIFIFLQACNQQQAPTGNPPSENKEFIGNKHETTEPQTIQQDNGSAESEEPAGNTATIFTHDLNEEMVYKDMEAPAPATDDYVLMESAD